MIPTRAFTLIESVICIVVLALAVPPTMELLSSAASARADAVNTTRSTQLAELVLESCLADIASDDTNLGYTALETPSTYVAGLRTRIETLTQPFESLGMAYAITVGSPVDRDGTNNFDETQNIFRRLTVTITYPSARGQDYELPVTMMVGDL